MTAIDAMPTPDLAAIKQKQQATWSSGDYHMIGTQILLTSERLLEALDVHSTERVLDVATGSGNAALAAARRGCEVVGIDYVPALLDHARKRAEAEVLEATFMEGDAEALPFTDGSFDVVTSVFGAMFAPDQERTASEIARVTRSGGRIGLVAHTPEGFIGQLFKTNARHVPPAPGLKSPVLWGTEARLRELFGNAIRRVEGRQGRLRALPPLRHHDRPRPMSRPRGPSRHQDRRRGARVRLRRPSRFDRGPVHQPVHLGTHDHRS